MSTNVVVVGFSGVMRARAKWWMSWPSTLISLPATRAAPTPAIRFLVGTKKYVLQLLPTGIIRPDKAAAIGNGVVVDPEALQQEIRKLEEAGASVDGRLKVSDRAHLILPYHRAHEVAAEAARGAGKIGTTAKGIGPAYEDKAGRRGLRACDLRDPAKFREKCTGRSGGEKPY